jgi:hypothetical protein
VAEEEREQQRPDVAAVDVGVGHDDDLAVAQLLEAELLLADPGADRADQRPDLVVLEHLVDARLLDVEDLALEGEDRLELALAALLGRAAGRITFDDVQLGVLAVARRAVGQLAGQVAAGERALADGLARLPRRLAGLRLRHRLQEHRLAHVAVALQVVVELLVHDLRDGALRCRCWSA